MKKIIHFNFLLIFFFYSQQIFPQWQMLDGPYETHGIKCLLNHPNGTLFAIGYENLYDNNTIYRSTNSGESWTKVFVSTISYYQLFSLSADSANGIYAGTYGGYYYSSDNGENWSLINLGITSWAVNSLVFNSLGNILIGVSDGIYLSSNAGFTWTQVLNSPTFLIMNYSNDTLFTATTVGVYISENGGLSWEARNNGLPQGRTRGIVRNLSGQLFTNTELGIYKSNDKGISWFLPDSSAYQRLFDLYIDKNDVLYGCTWYNISPRLSGIYRSRNDGFNWEYLGLGNNHQYHINCVMVDNNNILYAGNDRSLYKYSEIDSTWLLGNIYKSLGYIKAFAFCSDNSILASTSMRLWDSNDLGNSWTDLNDIQTPIILNGYDNRILIANPLKYSDNCGINWNTSNINYNWYSSVQRIYKSSNHDLFAGVGVDFFRSADNGYSWQYFYSFAYTYIDNTNDIALNSSGHIFISVYGNVYGLIAFTIKSTDNGNTFQSIYSAKQVFAIEIDNNDNIFLGTNGGGVLKSNDNGNTFLTTNTGLTNLYINDLIISPEGVLLAATNNGVHRYVDSLNLWFLVDNTGLVSKKIHNMQFKDDVLYVGTDIGLAYFSGPLPVELNSFTAFYSNPNVNLNWSTATELNNNGFEIERSFDKTSWATIGFREGKGTTSEPQDYTYSDDISEISLSELYYRLKQIDFNGSFKYSKIVEVEIAPTKFSLSQNYPNPFNPSTNLQYAISSRQFVTLKIYDVLGKEIATLVNEEKSAGSYETEFNASHLASGIYYYQLRAGDYVETKKMILMK